MEYRVYDLVDRGYASQDVPGVSPLPEIDGLDNRKGERFTHLGYVYPEQGAIWAEQPGVAVIMYGDDLEDGFLLDDPIGYIVAAWGWPEGSYIGADGLPRREYPV